MRYEIPNTSTPMTPEHTDISEVLAEINGLVSWCYENAKKDISIEKLMSVQTRVSSLSYTLAYMAADCKDEYNSKYYIRKIEHNRKKNAFINVGDSAAKAESMAFEENDENYKAEIEAESMAYRCDLLLKQVNKVLSSLQQRISFAKMQYSDSKLITN